MANVKYTTPEERLAAKRASARRTAAKKHAMERFAETPMERLLEGTAYTPEERKDADAVQGLEKALLAAAARLNRRVAERLQGEGRFAEAERLRAATRRLVIAAW